MQKELNELISIASNNANMINNLEQKIRQLSSEKRDLELLLTK